MSLLLLQGPALAVTCRAVLKSFGDVLLADPTTAWIVGPMEGAVAAIEAATTSSGAESSTAALTQAIADADDGHDQSVYVLWHLLKAAEHKALLKRPADPEGAEAWAAVRRVLFPDGRRQTTKPYLVEAFEARAAFDSLTEPQRRALRQLSFDGGDALQLAEGYVAHADTLGELLQKRGSISATADLETSLGAARLELLTHARRLLNQLPISGLSANLQAAVRGPFEDAIRAAQRRQAQRAKGGDVSPEAAPIPLDEAAEAPALV